MEKFAYGLGVQLALEHAGIISQERLTKQSSAASLTSRLFKNMPAGMALGGATGALTAGEGNRMQGALMGGALGTAGLVGASYAMPRLAKSVKSLKRLEGVAKKNPDRMMDMRMQQLRTGGLSAGLAGAPFVGGAAGGALAGSSGKPNDRYPDARNVMPRYPH